MKRARRFNYEHPDTGREISIDLEALEEFVYNASDLDTVDLEAMDDDEFYHWVNEYIEGFDNGWEYLEEGLE